MPHPTTPQHPTRFGAFIAPYHGINGNPTLQIRRDLDLVAHLDDLGYEEAWIGEHHSAGYETIASPELFIAAAAEKPAASASAPASTPSPTTTPSSSPTASSNSTTNPAAASCSAQAPANSPPTPS